MSNLKPLQNLYIMHEHFGPSNEMLPEWNLGHFSWLCAFVHVCLGVCTLYWVSVFLSETIVQLNQPLPEEGCQTAMHQFL